jgi:hypothetical protein
MQNRKPTQLQIIIHKLLLFIRAWNEALILFPIAIASWIVIPYLIRQIDPTAGVYDTGVLMKFMYAAVGTVICHFTAWLMIRFTFPYLFNYMYGKFNSDLYDADRSTSSAETLHKRQCKRLNYSLLLLSIYLLSFILILTTL